MKFSGNPREGAGRRLGVTAGKKKKRCMRTQVLESVAVNRRDRGVQVTKLD